MRDQVEQRLDRWQREVDVEVEVGCLIAVVVVMVAIVAVAVVSVVMSAAVIAVVVVARIAPEEPAISRATATARRLVEGSVSPNTRRAYAGALRLARRPRAP